MDILGIGIPELVFILLIALIVLGPKDMEKAGKTVGSWLNRVVKSNEWKSITKASRKLKTLPNDLMREANLDELKNELGDFTQYRNNKIKVTLPKDDYGAWGGRPTSKPIVNRKRNNTIAPPADIESAPAKKADAHPEPETDNPAPEASDHA